MGGGKRLVGCGQISLASNSKANGLSKLCNYGVMTREPVEGFVLILSFGAGLQF